MALFIEAASAAGCAIVEDAASVASRQSCTIRAVQEKIDASKKRLVEHQKRIADGRKEMEAWKSIKYHDDRLIQLTNELKAVVQAEDEAATRLTEWSAAIAEQTPKLAAYVRRSQHVLDSISHLP